MLRTLALLLLAAPLAAAPMEREAPAPAAPRIVAAPAALGPAGALPQPSLSAPSLSAQQALPAAALPVLPLSAPSAAAPAAAAATTAASAPAGRAENLRQLVDLSKTAAAPAGAGVPATYQHVPEHVDNSADPSIRPAKPAPGASGGEGARSRRIAERMGDIAARVFPVQAVPQAPRASATKESGAALTPASAPGSDAPAPPAPPAPPGGPDGQGPKTPWHKRPAVQILLSVAAAAAFNLGLYLHSGAQAAQEFLSTYLIEWTMSLDNIVVLSTAILAAPPASRGKVTRWALLGSIAARMIMVTAGVGLVAAHAALFYAFGAFLLATALKMLKPEWDLMGLALKPFGKLFKRGGAAGAKPAKSWLSPTVKVVLAIVGINVVFALDSVPAALAISKNAVVIIAANAFSLVGLGAVASFLDALEKRFSLLPKGVAAVLVFVGGKMIVEPLLHVSMGALASTAVIVGLLGGSALLSLLRAKR